MTGDGSSNSGGGGGWGWARYMMGELKIFLFRIKGFIF